MIIKIESFLKYNEYKYYLKFLNIIDIYIVSCYIILYFKRKNLNTK